MKMLLRPWLPMKINNVFEYAEKMDGDLKIRHPLRDIISTVIASDNNFAVSVRLNTLILSDGMAVSYFVAEGPDGEREPFSDLASALAVAKKYLSDRVLQ